MTQGTEGHRLVSPNNDGHQSLKVTDRHLLIMTTGTEGHRLVSSYNDTRV